MFPHYRHQFFSRLQSAVGPLTVVHGLPDEREGVVTFEARYSHRVSNIPLPGGVYWQLGALAAVRSIRPSVLVVEANPRLLSNVGLLSYARSTGIPSAVWGLGWRAKGAVVEDFLAKNSLRAQATLANGAIGYSATAARYYVHLSLTELFSGVAPNAVVPVPHEQAKPRSSGPLRLIYVGRLIEKKRVDVLLGAVARLGPEVVGKLVIAGSGPMETELRHFASKVSGRRVSLVGHQEGDALNRLLLDSDCFVLPGEGGLAVQQAIAYGLPIVCTPIAKVADTSVGEAIRHGYNGIIALDGSCESLSHAISALHETEERVEMGYRSRHLAETAGGIDGMVSGFASVISRLVRG